MICSLLSFQVLSVASLLLTVTPLHIYSLSRGTCCSPNTTSWVTFSYLCMCSCSHLVPDFLLSLPAYFLGLLQIYPIALHTSTGRYLDYSVNGACWRCAALYKMSPQGLLPLKRKFFCLPQTASVKFPLLQLPSHGMVNTERLFCLS